jgi:hypothetical protein
VVDLATAAGNAAGPNRREIMEYVRKSALRARYAMTCENPDDRKNMLMKLRKLRSHLESISGKVVTALGAAAPKSSLISSTLSDERNRAFMKQNRTLTIGECLFHINYRFQLDESVADVNAVVDFSSFRYSSDADMEEFKRKALRFIEDTRSEKGTSIYRRYQERDHGEGPSYASSKIDWFLFQRAKG